MSASRFDTGSVFPEFSIELPQGRFHLPTSTVQVRRNGLEFKSPCSLPVWAEMNVCLSKPGTKEALCCTGIVVACDGNRHNGFAISLLFLGLPGSSGLRPGLLAGPAAS